MFQTGLTVIRRIPQMFCTWLPNAITKAIAPRFLKPLPEWFIKLFTKEQGTVLDPFMGSGTTLIVANRMKRNSIGIDVVPEYCEMVKQQLKPTELYLLEPKVEYEKAEP